MKIKYTGDGVAVVDLGLTLYPHKVVELDDEVGRALLNERPGDCSEVPDNPAKPRSGKVAPKTEGEE